MFLLDIDKFLIKSKSFKENNTIKISSKQKKSKKNRNLCVVIIDDAFSKNFIVNLFISLLNLIKTA